MPTKFIEPLQGNVQVRSHAHEFEVGPSGEPREGDLAQVASGLEALEDRLRSAVSTLEGRLYGQGQEDSKARPASAGLVGRISDLIEDLSAQVARVEGIAGRL